MNIEDIELTKKQQIKFNIKQMISKNGFVIIDNYYKEINGDSDIIIYENKDNYKRNKSLLRLKFITTKFRDDSYRFKVCKNNGESYNDIDGYILICIESKIICFIECNKIGGKKHIRLRDKNKTYKHTGGEKEFLYIQDLSWDNFIIKFKKEEKCNDFFL